MNKKAVLLLICVFFLCNIKDSYSQIFKKSETEEPVSYEAPKMPIDKVTGLITYEGVVDIPGPSDSLYTKALGWFSEYYTNPNNVIREKNSKDKKIVCKYWFMVYKPEDEAGKKIVGATVQYSLNTYFRDGRFKYEFTELRKKAASVFPLEKWLDKSDPAYEELNNYYLIQVDENIKKEIGELIKGMQYVKPTENDDW